MKADLVNFENKVLGEVALNSSIFGLELRSDIIKAVIDWQRNKARIGSHSVKTVGEVSGTTKKPFKQKGTGNARQGNARGVQRRGGGIAHGPQIRSHATKLTKKYRSLGLRHALSAKFSENSLKFIDSVSMNDIKTKDLVKKLDSFGQGKFFIIDGSELDNNLKKSSSAVKNVNVVPVVGANVYDIINSDFVLVSKSALSVLEERLK